MRKTGIHFWLIGLMVTFFACKDDDGGTDDPMTVDSVQLYHDQGVGASANDLLASSTYDRLTIEFIYVDGYSLNDATINNIKSFLANRLHKPGGITVSETIISSPGLAPYSVGDLDSVEENYRASFINGSTEAVYVFVTDGSYSKSENVLGVAYRNTSLALFGNRIQDLSGGLGQPSKTLLETTVIEHEFGHIMGLVNVGTPMQSDHQDEENGKHCDVENCLMYYAVETGDIVSNLASSGSVPELDAQCLADLQANGGK